MHRAKCKPPLKLTGKSARSTSQTESDDEMKRMEQPAPWDRVEELRKAIESADELRALYARLGYSPHLDPESQRTVTELKSHKERQIVDCDSCAAFRNR